MLEHIERIDVVAGPRFVFFHCSRDGKPAFPENNLIFRIRFHTVHLEAASTQHLRKRAPARAEIDNFSGARWRRRNDLVYQPAIIVPRFLQQIEDIMSSILELGAGR